jgi:hypothetical protein
VPELPESPPEGVDVIVGGQDYGWQNRFGRTLGYR